jgi:phosphoenolpyruvate synthase/pyruvate phosphate dikinase
MNKINLTNLKNKEWYHQRFDGAPMFMSFIAFAEIKKEKRKPAGTEADIRVCFFDEGKADWYLDMKDVRRGSKVLIEKAKKDKGLSKKLLKAWKKDEELFDKFFIKFNKINLHSLNNNELLNLYKEYVTLAINRFTSSAVIDHFALGTDEIIEKMLRSEIKGLEKESDFTNIFSIATAPIHQSFINKAEIELLKIIIKNPKDVKIIETYQKKYYWTKNNYIQAQTLSVGYFKSEIKNWLKSKKDLRTTLAQLQNTPAINRQKKAQLLKKNRLSPLLKTLITISEDFTWWQDERKRATYLNIDMGTKILSEMAKRTDYEMESLKFLLTAEIAEWFLKKNISREELRQRMLKSVIIVTRDGFETITGKKVDNVKKIIIGNKKKDEIQDIRGLSASTGRVIGKVKVVGSAREIDKIIEGDILVAVMTRPDYIAGMKKAAAVVTNEGGITCHAAIVSRELGIPCIIGTKIATQVLKDGDLVEVNANHGWVRKIK